MKKTDKETWNNTWNNIRSFDSMQNIDNVIFRELSKFVQYRGKEIIELGCGTGTLSYLMMKNGAKKCTLVDFSDSALNHARRLFRNLNNVTFILSDLFKLDETKKYDIAFSSGLAEHFSDNLREEIIFKHLKMTRDIAVLIVPARPHFNTIRHRKGKVRVLFGWQYSFSKREIREIVSKSDGFDIILNRRFYPLYGVNSFALLSVDSKFIFFRLWNFALHNIDIILNKARLYMISNVILTPFSNKLGGLLLTVIKKRC
jgi:SAM-dependent methyltransferase